MTRFLISHFIKTDTHVREQYGILSGAVGIALNILLFFMKLVIGLISGSLSIIADSLNNFSDFTSSIITIAGFKIAAKPADDKHPFGHARVEYISGLIISLFIVAIGFQIIFSSIQEIISGGTIIITTSTYIILLLSITIKFWLYKFNSHLGAVIASTTILATAQDSLNDVYVSLGILLSIAISEYTGFNLDAYIGFAVAAFIIYSGAMLIKETIDPLLGAAPDESLVATIRENILSYDGVLGVHDLLIHSYGPDRIYVSAHVEVDSRVDITTSHDLVDGIENYFIDTLGIEMVIHLDPIQAAN
ncbi:cation diffusion facilitator family transporter [Candidatus Epulonipiscium viviparus]|uniref:cation diffusion facilitator family transporter n=1 Tax=Candidatus Epulonipiscium viviparus TaxID=420336 RepID=UPI0027380A38|nr:cation diffusion facilitator family transporter [Candidatus Epulopiscium viviparus]